MNKWNDANEIKPVTKQKWCEGSLVSDDVLGIDKWGRFSVVTYIGFEGDGHFECTEPRKEKITHWMYLPKLPEHVWWISESEKLKKYRKLEKELKIYANRYKSGETHGRMIEGTGEIMDEAANAILEMMQDGT